ncbi:MAG: hypothetical protein M0P66_17385 [Salinivirgaceae bacterium]|nr:hypothetical protein [Salinivirgaceae bacterium]
MKQIIVFSLFLILLFSCITRKNVANRYIVDEGLNCQIKFNQDPAILFSKIDFNSAEKEILKGDPIVELYLYIDLCNNKLNVIRYKSQDSISMSLFNSIENKIINCYLNNLIIKAKPIFKSKPMICDTNVLYYYSFPEPARMAE